MSGANEEVAVSLNVSLPRLVLFSLTKNSVQFVLKRCVYTFSVRMNAARVEDMRERVGPSCELYLYRREILRKAEANLLIYFRNHS